MWPKNEQRPITARKYDYSYFFQGIQLVGPVGFDFTLFFKNTHPQRHIGKYISMSLYLVSQADQPPHKRY